MTSEQDGMPGETYPMPTDESGITLEEFFDKNPDLKPTLGDIYDFGCSEERALIVAWLRSNEAAGRRLATGGRQGALDYAAAIERGEHSSDRQANENAGNRSEKPNSSTACRDCGHAAAIHHSAMPHRCGTRHCRCLVYAGR